MSSYKIATKCLQSGYQPKNGEPRVLPIYQSTTFKYDSSEEIAQLFVKAPLSNMIAVKRLHSYLI